MAFHQRHTYFIISMIFQKPEKNLPPVMREYVQSDKCKRKEIMGYLEYDEYLKTWAVQLGIASKFKISIGGSQG